MRDTLLISLIVWDDTHLIPVEDIDLSESPSEQGLGSLMAVEVRNLGRDSVDYTSRYELGRTVYMMYSDDISCPGAFCLSKVRNCACKVSNVSHGIEISELQTIVLPYRADRGGLLIIDIHNL